MRLAIYVVAAVSAISAWDTWDMRAAPITQTSQPACAVAGTDRVVDVGQQVCLDARESFHPMGQPFVTWWQQIAGPPVVLDTNDCWVVGPSTWTWGFVLTADDAAGDTRASILVRVRRL